MLLILSLALVFTLLFVLALLLFELSWINRIRPQSLIYKLQISKLPDHQLMISSSVILEFSSPHFELHEWRAVEWIKSKHAHMRERNLHFKRKIEWLILLILLFQFYPCYLLQQALSHYRGLFILGH